VTEAAIARRLAARSALKALRTRPKGRMKSRMTTINFSLCWLIQSPPGSLGDSSPINGLRDHHECCHRAGTKDIAIPIVQRPTPAQMAKAPPKGKP
jgi:hypothetical protein